jgi:acyl-CoA thioesterase FadM
MSENVRIVVVDEVEHVIIDRGNGEFTSMPKSVYDEQQAAQEALAGK